MNLKFTLYAVVVTLAFLFHPSISSAACGETSVVDYPNPGSIELFDACATYADAMSACQLLESEHNYEDHYCIVNDGVIRVGWLCENGPVCHSGDHTYYGQYYYYQYSAIAVPTPAAQCDSCVKNYVPDPINPASGAVFTTEVSLGKRGSNALTFNQFYNSSDSGAPDLSAGWRHSYSRHISARYSAVNYQPSFHWTTNADYSRRYNDASAACTSGFTDIKSRIGTWQNATTSSTSGVCALLRNGVTIGTLPIMGFLYIDPQSPPLSSILPALYSMAAQVAPIGSSSVGFDVTRDDGQLITFWLSGGVASAPPGIDLKLQQTAGGYTLTDAQDNVESYDINGKLLSITSRAGVVQTMAYDGAGHLSTVTDSFGHSMTLTYDGQGRLSSVTRP